MSAAPFINNREPGDHERGRRWFLVRASAAAAAGLSIAGETFNAPCAAAQAAPLPPQGGVQSFTAAGLQNAIANLEASPGNNTLVDGKTFTVALTVEKNKAAKEFEWHEGRDHVFQILEGSTVFELGGTPKNARNTKPGEWLAPESENAVKLTLNKGDMLVIPRGVPHRRTTAGSVTLMLISPQGAVA
jgi:mannose-6-phosphate isomerase-like protein (cupin superfamily)